MAVADSPADFDILAATRDLEAAGIEGRHAEAVIGVVRAGRAGLRRKGGAQGRNRTTDTRIFSPLLYRLSYLGAGRAVRRRRGLSITGRAAGLSSAAAAAGQGKRGCCSRPAVSGRPNMRLKFCSA